MTLNALYGSNLTTTLNIQLSKAEQSPISEPYV